MSNKIDERFEDTVPLMCEKCGCICSTKNIDGIGHRGIKPIWDGLDNFSINYLALTYCNQQNHLIKDLRTLTDDEVNGYKQEGSYTKENTELAMKVE